MRSDARDLGGNTTGMVLTNANFQSAGLGSARLSHCDLTNANFLDAVIGGADFEDSTLDGANLSARPWASCR